MIIESHLLSKRFRKAEAVSGVSLCVPEGSVTALVGANGAGKTTLMRLLVNLLPPDSGEARVLGVATAALGAADFARLGYVSEGQLLPNGLTVEQYFDYLRALYPKWDRKREDEVRRAFDLPPTRKLGQLSRGMQMKARIASVLPYRPALLVLDEPLSGLDPLARDEVLEGLLANAEETTILLSSHELTEIEGCATHLAFMDQGRLLVDDSVEELSGRFRDVTAGFVNDPPQAKLPASWLSPTWSGRTLHFTCSSYASDDDLTRRLTAMLGPLAHLSTQALSLRDTSKALIRAHRREAN